MSIILDAFERRSCSDMPSGTSASVYDACYLTHRNTGRGSAIEGIGSPLDNALVHSNGKKGVRMG